jgi:predicted RNA-binding protein
MMCLATVYVENGCHREEVIQDVAWIRPQGGGLQLISFMGESRQLFQAEIKSIDMVNSLIVLERMTTNPSQNDIQLEEGSDG